MSSGGDQPVFIYTTFSTREDAERVSGALVTKRLAACVNMFPGMVSVYEWKGEVATDSEVAAIVKTRREKAEQAMAELKRLHPYELPAIILLPSDGGSAEFRNWIAQMTGGG